MSIAPVSQQARIDQPLPVQPDQPNQPAATSPTGSGPAVPSTPGQTLLAQPTLLSQAVDTPSPLQQALARPSGLDRQLRQPGTEDLLSPTPTGIGDLYASNRPGGAQNTGLSNIPPGTSQINLHRAVGVPGQPHLGEVYLHQRVGPQGNQFFAQARNGMHPLRATNLNDAVSEARGHLRNGGFSQPFAGRFTGVMDISNPITFGSLPPNPNDPFRPSARREELRQLAVLPSNPTSAANAKRDGFMVTDDHKILLTNTYEGGVRYVQYFGRGGPMGTQGVGMPDYASPEFQRAVNEWNTGVMSQRAQEAIGGAAHATSRRSARPPDTASPDVPALQSAAPPNRPGGPPTVIPARSNPTTANPPIRPNTTQPSGITSQNPYQIESRAPGGPTSRTARGDVTSQGPGSDLVVGTAGPRQLPQARIDAFVAQLNSPGANQTYSLGGLSVQTNHRGQPLELTSQNVRLVTANRANVQDQRGIGHGWDGSGRGVGSHLLNARWAPDRWPTGTPISRSTVVPQSSGYNTELYRNFEATVDRLASIPGNRVDVRTRLSYEPDGVTLRNLVHEYRVNGGEWVSQPMRNK
jgi:hypothetical protein